MFFWRERLSSKKARALLIELFDQRYQWPLREPIIRFLARGDPLRFLCSLGFLVDWVGQGIYLLNRKQPNERNPWFGDDLSAAVADLSLKPKKLVDRLLLVLAMEEPPAAELEMRRLLLEIIDLVPIETKRGQPESEQPVVSWLPRTAPLEEVVQPESQSFDNGGDMRRLAQRAVRIVWRLPGSRLAALTGSIATGHADLASDIDISLFGLKLADARVRRSLIAAMSDAPDDITQLTAETHAADAFWLDGRLADVRYFLISEARRLIADPVPQSQADYELLTRLSTADILVDYEFRGPNLTRDLQQATRRARDERMARASDHFHQAARRLEASVEPPDIFCATVEAVLALFRLLAARNDRWILFPKWTAVWLEGLQTVPPDIHARLSDVALLPFHRKNVQSKLDTLRAIAGEITGI